MWTILVPCDESEAIPFPISSPIRVPHFSLKQALITDSDEFGNAKFTDPWDMGNAITNVPERVDSLRRAGSFPARSIIKLCLGIKEGLRML